MVNLITPFRKILSISFNSSSNINSHVSINLCVLSQKCIKSIKTMTLWNITELNGE